jgi:hypothetical protein
MEQRSVHGHGGGEQRTVIGFCAYGSVIDMRR